MPEPLASLLVSPNIAGADGISMLSRQLASALGRPSAVLSLHDVEVSTTESVRVIGSGGSRLRFCANAAKVSRLCGDQTSIVCCHVHLAPVARLLVGRQRPMVMVLCGVEAWTPLRAAERWALASSQLVAISAETARRFKGANPDFRDTEISVLHPGLPEFGASKEADVLEAALSPRGGSWEPEGNRMALIVGRMAADEGYKGHDVLIDVWPRVIARHPSAVLCVVGDGTDRPRLEAKAVSTGLGGSVVFTGKVDEPTLDALYRQCRFFIMPSRDEGFGFVFLEAMRAGKACVAAIGAASEIVRDGETGLIVDPADPDQVCAAAVRLFDDELMCARFGEAGAARFRSLFTATAFRNRLAAVVPASMTPATR